MQWAEVWSSLMIHLDMKQFRTAGRRAFTASHYTSRWTLGARGAVHSRRWLGLTATEQAIAREFLGKQQLAENASLWDEHPVRPFLISMDSALELAMGNDAQAFFGQAGPRSGALKHVVFNHSVLERHAALIARVQLRLEPGADRRIGFVWGYTATELSEKELHTLARKHATLLEGDLATGVSLMWKPKLTRFDMASEPWVRDEISWHSYYVHGGLSYDSFLNQHMLDQGASYRYGFGFQGAARDPVQHALPLVELAPKMALSVLMSVLKQEQLSLESVDPRRKINLPYGLTASGVLFPLDYNTAPGVAPDDMELFVLLLASEYMLATKDVEFLNHTVPFFNSTTTHTVLEALLRCLRFLVYTVGVGEHGMMRTATSDWDDNLMRPLQSESVYNHSESMLAAATATFVLDRFSEAMNLATNLHAAREARQFAAKNRIGLAAGFSGQWLRRVFLDTGLGWVGDEAGGIFPGLFTPQQAWGMLGGVFNVTGLSRVLSNLAGCREAGWRFGAPYYCNMSQAGQPLPAGAGLGLGEPAGGSVGSMWYSLNHPLVMGLVAVNQTEMAWDEFVRNSLHHQAATAPHVWSGVWTSGDVSHNDASAGPWNDTTFPALCMHRHAWPLVSLRTLVGVHYDAHGLVLRPGFPTRLGAYSYRVSEMISLSWDGADRFVGHYTPHTAGRWMLVVDMSRVTPIDTLITVERTDSNRHGTTRQVASGVGEIRIRAKIDTWSMRFIVRTKVSHG